MVLFRRDAFSRAAVLTLALALAAPCARAEDVTIDAATLQGADGGQIAFKTILLRNANISRDDAQKLFSGALDNEARDKMLAGLTADEIAIEQADLHGRAGENFTLKNISAKKIAGGGAQNFDIDATEGVLPNDSGDSLLHLGAAHFEKLFLPRLAEALKANDHNPAGLRFDRMKWEGGEASIVEKQTPAGAPGGNRMILRAGAGSIDQTFGPDGLPLTSEARFDGVSLKLPPSSRAAQALAAFGYGEISGRFAMASAYDPAAQTLALKSYRIDIDKVGRISASGQVSKAAPAAVGVDPEARRQAMMAATLDFAQIDIVNDGAFEKAVAFTALSQRQPAEAVKAQWKAIVAQAPLLFSGASSVTVAAKEVEKFISDPNKGLSLRLTARDTPLTLADIAATDNLPALLSRVNISAPAAR